jgi:hypothetical protein
MGYSGQGPVKKTCRDCPLQKHYSLEANRMTESRLKRLMDQREAVTARIKKEQGKLRAGERKSDTRRKVLAGAAVLEWAKRDSEFSSRLMAELKRFLVRDADRALFNFAPLLRTEDARQEDARPEARMRA